MISRIRRLTMMMGLVLAAATVLPACADDVLNTAHMIDSHIAARWKAEGVTPTVRSDDEEFFRRINLHLGGVIPTVWEVRAFLEDQSPNKRRKAVDNLLRGPRYVAHFTSTWRKVMVPETETDPNFRQLAPEFEAWLREHLVSNTPYDQMVREVLTAPLARANSMLGGQPVAEASPAGFYVAKEMKPENLAAGSARTFLGVRIDCAQCHDHPFDAWKRPQFWGYAAFFASLVPASAQNGDVPLQRTLEIFDRRELPIPDLSPPRVIQATYLNGEMPVWKPRQTARQSLAEWMTASTNPFFARATVNRLWAHFFGLGLVDPVDDLSPANLPSHPELLDDLAIALVKHHFDLQFLMRAIATSETYQLSSQRTAETQDDPRQFARMTVQGLTSESVLRSLLRATGAPAPANADPNVFAFQQGPEQEFRELFANLTDRPIDRQTSILQALLLMNGPLTDFRNSRTVAALLTFPGLTMQDQVEGLYLATLARRPTPAEAQPLIELLGTAKSQQEQQQILSDVLWALVNSSEFLFNH